MPNFNVHWLVAFRGLSGQFDVPWYLTRGFEFYRLNTLALGASVREELNSIASDDELFGFFKNPISFNTHVRDRFWDVANTYYGNLARKPRDYNAVTCFSAFALGACGPDFWTMGSESKLSSKKMTAGLHFDLGHYNRTHQQFRVSAARLSKIDPKIILGTSDENAPPEAGWDKATLSARAEFSYFLGMATHLATDLVVHQLVNVSAGAYNILDKPWKNEQGVTQELVNLWSTHNKVEHFWDTYARYRYFSDYGKIFSDEGREWTASLNFPSVETLLREAEKQPADRQKRIKKILSIEAVRLAIETGFNFPRIFADRLRSGSIDPFIHQVVVNKTKGAYPTDDVFKEAATEAVSDQMRMERSTSNDERRKVGAFATANNRGSDWYTLNMVNYFACPSLEKVKKYG